MEHFPPFDWDSDNDPGECPIRAQDTALMDSVLSSGQTCSFCDQALPVFEEGDFEVAQFQILREHGDAWLVCHDHFIAATSGAPRANISHVGMVSTLYAPALVTA